MKYGTLSLFLIPRPSSFLLHPLPFLHPSSLFLFRFPIFHLSPFPPLSFIIDNQTGLSLLCRRQGVERVRVSKSGWSLTAESLAKFLTCLDHDPEQAAEKYEQLRESLVKFLDWRGALFPEELVDETFNRVARKLDEGETIRDLPAYCHGVARLVFLQSLEHPSNKRVDFEALQSVAAREPEPVEPDQLRQCFRSCLNNLPAESRELITTYYQSEKRQKIDNRSSIAIRLGIPINALRSRAQRIRDKLEKCITRCKKKDKISST